MTAEEGSINRAEIAETATPDLDRAARFITELGHRGSYLSTPVEGDLLTAVALALEATDVEPTETKPTPEAIAALDAELYGPVDPNDPKVQRLADIMRANPVELRVEGEI